MLKQLLYPSTPTHHIDLKSYHPLPLQVHPFLNQLCALFLLKQLLYGRQEEVYQCEDCSGCPYAERCKKGDRNRTIRLNQELTAMHREVLDNLNSTHGALLRMNRSIQAEGTFGIVKQDRQYRRIVRRSLDLVRMELFLVSIGHNLYKYHNKQLKSQKAA